MTLAYHVLDVFTDTPSAGNPLAVVLEADRLSTADMQRVAREFNLSETVFVLRAKGPAHSAAVRIFTPERELPFAGHPTVGVACLLAELRFPEAVGERDALVVLEQEIGVVRVGVRLRKGVAAHAEFDAPRLPVDGGRLESKDVIAAALGLIPSEIGFENHQPLLLSAGPSFALVPVADLDAMQRVRVDGEQLAKLCSGSGFVGAYLYTRECIHTASAFHARMFAPGVGVAEDPATGSAAICLAAAVHRFDGLPDGVHRRAIEQGLEMGRPSLIRLTLVVEGGRLVTVRIGGDAVRVREGVLSS